MAIAVAVLAGTAAVGACGGSSKSSAAADPSGPTASAGQTSAPQLFQAVNAKMATAIAGAQAKLSPTAPAGQNFAPTEALVSQALTQWQSGVLPVSDDIQAITQALQALKADFATPPVNRVKATEDIGTYDAAATRYEQGEHVATSAG